MLDDLGARPAAFLVTFRDRNLLSPVFTSAAIFETETWALVTNRFLRSSSKASIDLQYGHHNGNTAANQSTSTGSGHLL